MGGQGCFCCQVIALFFPSLHSRSVYWCCFDSKKKVVHLPSKNAVKPSTAAEASRTHWQSLSVLERMGPIPLLQPGTPSQALPSGRLTPIWVWLQMDPICQFPPKNVTWYIFFQSSPSAPNGKMRMIHLFRSLWGKWKECFVLVLPPVPVKDHFSGHRGVLDKGGAKAFSSTRRGVTNRPPPTHART